MSLDRAIELLKTCRESCPSLQIFSEVEIEMVAKTFSVMSFHPEEVVMKKGEAA